MSEQQPRHEQGPLRAEAKTPKLPNSLEDKTTRDLEAVFQRLVVNAVTLVGARAGSLALVSPASKKPVPLANYSPDGSWPFPPEYSSIIRWVTTRRISALIDKTSADPRMRPADTSPIGSLMCVPLLVGQDVLGTLMLSNPRPGAFNAQHVRLLEMVADLAAATVQQARQQEAAAQQAYLLGTVVKVGQALSNTRDMRHVLSLTTAGIRRLIICEEAVLFSYEEVTQELRGVAGLGTQSARLAEQRIFLHDDHSVTAWVARQRRPLLHSSGSRAFVGPITDTLLTRADLALLAVPLVAQQQLWGVITLARPEPFDTNDLRTMLNLSSFVAPALAQATSPAGTIPYPAGR